MYTITQTPLLCAGDDFRTRSITRTISGVTNVVALQFLQNLTATKLNPDTTFRIPDYFGRDKTIGSHLNLYLMTPLNAIVVNVVFPAGLDNVAGGSPALQNLVPLRVFAAMPLIANTYRKFVSAPGETIEPGAVITIQWRGAAIPASGLIGEVALSKPALEAEDLFVRMPSCPLVLGSGESFANTPTGCTIILNRLLTIGDQLGLVAVEAKNITNGPYTLTSSKTAIIPNSGGTISNGASLIIYSSPIASTPTVTSITLTVVFPGLGSEAFFGLGGGIL